MFLTSISLSFLSSSYRPISILWNRSKIREFGGRLWCLETATVFPLFAWLKALWVGGLELTTLRVLELFAFSLSLSPAFFPTRLQLFESPPASCQLDSLRKHLHTPPASHWGNRCMVEKFEQYGKADRWRICIQAVSPGSDKAVKWHLCPGFVRVTIILIRWAVFEKALPNESHLDEFESYERPGHINQRQETVEAASTLRNKRNLPSVRTV